MAQNQLKYEVNLTIGSVECCHCGHLIFMSDDFEIADEAATRRAALRSARNPQSDLFAQQLPHACGAEMRSSVQIACEVLDELENYSGFEDWWNGLTDDTRDEILTRLSSVVHEDWAQGPVQDQPSPDETVSPL